MRLKRSPWHFALCLLLIGPRGATAGVDLLIRHSDLPDGVEKWEVSAEGTEKPVFFAMLENLPNQTLDQDDLPFRRSIAFLVGVGAYDHLKPLPGVEQDLRRVREYLLYRGGFDEVYQVRDHAAKAELIGRYLTGGLGLGAYDRLLFYYSGHGANQVKDFSYLQMAEAIPGDFTVNNAINTNEVVRWSRILGGNNHALFILDSCSVNVGLTPRDDISFAGKMFRDIAAESSRIVMTASTERGRAYEDPEEGGIFTKALIDALEAPQTSDIGYLTSYSVFAMVYEAVSRKGTKSGVRMKPERIPLDPDQHEGDFLFLRVPQARAVPKPARKGKVSIRVGPWGDIRVFPLDGTRGQQAQEVPEGPRSFDLPEGEYEARIVNDSLNMELVKVFTVQADRLTEIHAKFPVQVEQLLREHGLTDSAPSPSEP